MRGDGEKERNRVRTWPTYNSPDPTGTRLRGDSSPLGVQGKKKWGPAIGPLSGPARGKTSSSPTWPTPKDKNSQLLSVRLPKRSILALLFMRPVTWRGARSVACGGGLLCTLETPAPRGATAVSETQIPARLAFADNRIHDVCIRDFPARLHLCGVDRPKKPPVGARWLRKASADKAGRRRLGRDAVTVWGMRDGEWHNRKKREGEGLKRELGVGKLGVVDKGRRRVARIVSFPLFFRRAASSCSACGVV